MDQLDACSAQASTLVTPCVFILVVIAGVAYAYQSTFNGIVSRYCDGVFSSMDMDASGNLDVSEVEAGILKLFYEINVYVKMKPPSRQDIASYVKKLDKDGNSKLDREEFQGMMKVLGSSMSARGVTMFIATIAAPFLAKYIVAHTSILKSVEWILASLYIGHVVRSTLMTYAVSLGLMTIVSISADKLADVQKPKALPIPVEAPKPVLPINPKTNADKHTTQFAPPANRRKSSFQAIFLSLCVTVAGRFFLTVSRATQMEIVAAAFILVAIYFHTNQRLSKLSGAAFDSIDQDGNGTIDMAELEVGLLKLYAMINVLVRVKYPSRVEIKAHVQRIDENGDSKLSRHEFMTLAKFLSAGVALRTTTMAALTWASPILAEAISSNKPAMPEVTAALRSALVSVVSPSLQRCFAVKVAPLLDEALEKTVLAILLITMAAPALFNVYDYILLEEESKTSRLSNLKKKGE